VPTNGTVEVEHPSPDTAIVALRGEHDLETRRSVTAALASARAARNIVVDLSACTFADSFVITSILRAWREQHDARGQLAIAVSEPVQRTLELIGIESLLPLYATRHDALVSLAPHVRLRLLSISDRIDHARARRAA
jgi:stage II sporulation protein AA (anti-sigma F factor antagonist)